LLEFPLPVAPIAFAPPLPEVSTPAKLITVIEEITLCDTVAVTVTFESVVVANARQISDAPA
jgi:hypothetical protein